MEWNLKLRNVPEQLVRQAKSIAALKGQTLNDFVIAAIKLAVEPVKSPKK